METDPDRPGPSEVPDGRGSAGRGSPRGADPAAGDPGTSPPRAEEAAASSPEYDYAGPAPPDAPGPGTDPAPDPATGMRATTPRAMLRPVPEGFPTPPPRPARPNRRPAKAEPDPPARRRGALIAALAVVAVLVLTVGIGSSILVYRALSPDDQPPPASGPSDPASPTDQGPAEVRIGEVTVREVSTEVGVRSVGEASTSREPEGEFVVLTVEIINDSDYVAMPSGHITLATADGRSHSPDREATRAHLASTEPFAIIPEHSSGTGHVVFDLPVGSEPVAAHIDLDANPSAGSGELLLGA